MMGEWARHDGRDGGEQRGNDCWPDKQSSHLLSLVLVRPLSIILETDPATIASRVSRPRPDATEIQINEQSECMTWSCMHAAMRSLTASPCLPSQPL